jgi:exodeoxyribonuclease-5
MDIDDSNPEHIVERLVKEPWMQSQFPSNHLVIVDEASMVSKALRFGRDGIQHNISKSRTKVIFLGDECQLPPVGERASVVFSEKKFVKIEEVVRQSKGNPLLEVLVGMRDRLMESESLQRRTAIEDGKGIRFVLDQRELLDKAIEMFGIQKETGNAQYCRLLAWTNEQVKFYNFTIRNKLIGNAPKNFIKGEVVICLKPVVNAEGEGLA